MKVNEEQIHTFKVFTCHFEYPWTIEYDRCARCFNVNPIQ